MIEGQENHQDDVKAENEFLKLKLMAEFGGQFFTCDTNEGVPADVENEFLSNVIEFERQFSSHRQITVYEKIGSPQHFKAEAEISEEKIEQAWNDLSEYMTRHGVALSVCSPRVTSRELYRFATEELFNHETDDIKIAGMMTGFIYDEFYPDHEYDNTRAALDHCLRQIFNKEPFEWMYDFADEIRFNGYVTLTRNDFKKMINEFKNVHDEIELDSVDAESCKILDKLCTVKGIYEAHAKLENENIEYKGNWMVGLLLNDDSGYWYINNVQLENIAV